MHHALFIPRTYPSRGDVEIYLQDEGTLVNSDMLIHITDTLKIDDARYISEQAFSLPGEGSFRTIVLGFQIATREAQNALLKTFEDPIPSTRFLIFAPSLKGLLPTLASRLSQVTYSFNDKIEIDPHKAFLSLSLSERFAYVAKITTKEEALNLVTSLIHSLHDDPLTYKDSLKVLEESTQYLSKPSSSIKMILENICIGIPRK